MQTLHYIVHTVHRNLCRIITRPAGTLNYLIEGSMMCCTDAVQFKMCSSCAIHCILLKYGIIGCSAVKCRAEAPSRCSGLDMGWNLSCNWCTVLSSMHNMQHELV